MNGSHALAALFVASAVLLSWRMPSIRARNRLLLGASWLACILLDDRLLPLVLGATLLAHFVGGRLGSAQSQRARRAWRVAGWIGCGALLAAFAGLSHLGAGGARTAPPLLVPIGLGYLVLHVAVHLEDLDREPGAPRPTFGELALYLAFFPKLIAGPFVRTAEFRAQLARRPRWAEIPARAYLALALTGFVKKYAVADQLAPLLDVVFERPDLHGAAALWSALLLNAAWLYCDVSGYADLALATAGLAGFDLPENFDHPYFAAGPREFWQRWLRSVGALHLDGLPGGRPPRVVLSMTLFGLWHSPRATFLAFGLLHGLVLRAADACAGCGARLGRAARPLGVVATFLFCAHSFVLLRAGDLASAGEFMARQWSLAAGASLGAGPLLVFIVLAATHALTRSGWPLRAIVAMPDWLFALLGGALTATALVFLSESPRPFVYHRF